MTINNADYTYVQFNCTIVYDSFNVDDWDDKVNKVKLNTKENILYMATKLIAEQGFDGVTLRAISDKCETSLNSIRHHYGSKEDLLIAILEEMNVSVYEAPLRIIDQGAESQEEFGTKLKLYLSEVLAQLMKHRDLIRVTIREGHRCQSKKNGHYIPQQAAIVKFIKDGQKKGFLNPNIDAAMIGGVFMDRLLPQAVYADHLKKQYKIDMTNASYRRKWINATITLFLEGLNKRSE